MSARAPSSSLSLQLRPNNWTAAYCSVSLISLPIIHPEAERTCICCASPPQSNASTPHWFAEEIHYNDHHDYLDAILSAAMVRFLLRVFCSYSHFHRQASLSLYLNSYPPSTFPFSFCLQPFTSLYILFTLIFSQLLKSFPLSFLLSNPYLGTSSLSARHWRHSPRQQFAFDFRILNHDWF